MFSLLKWGAKPGFVWYPSLKDAYKTFLLITCGRCGGKFLQEPKYIVHPVYDEEHNFIRHDYINVARNICTPCLRSSIIDPPAPTEAELEAKEEIIKYRRRGGEHERRNWKFITALVKEHLIQHGPKTTRQLLEAVVGPKVPSSNFISQCAKHGLELVPTGEELEPKQNKFYRIYGIRGIHGEITATESRQGSTEAIPEKEHA